MAEVCVLSDNSDLENLKEDYMSPAREEESDDGSKNPRCSDVEECSSTGADANNVEQKIRWTDFDSDSDDDFIPWESFNQREAEKAFAEVRRIGIGRGQKPLSPIKEEEEDRTEEKDVERGSDISTEDMSSESGTLDDDSDSDVAVGEWLEMWNSTFA